VGSKEQQVGLVGLVRLIGLVSATVFAAALAGCAARGPSPAALLDVSRADQLVRDGCYRCLTEALAIYQRLLDPSARIVGVGPRAFETALLIALREKELGIPPAAAFDRAKTIAATLQPLPGTPAPGVFIELAELVQGEISGLENGSRTRPPNAAARVKALVPVLQALQPPTLLAEYVNLALTCEDRVMREAIKAEEVLARHGSPPLLRFRLGLCGVGPAKALEQLRASDPRWVDTAFSEGRNAISLVRLNLRRALELYGIAHNAFPSSPAIQLALAGVQRALVQLPAALASYDGVIAAVPAHREALLGRVVTLTYMERREEAVATATRIIDLGTWMIGDAYYWRAFNRYHLKQFEEAWADVEVATGLMANTNVYTLAGLIAYSRTELDTAKDRFSKAWAMDRKNCYAAWYLGVVHADQNLWPAAAPIFTSSMSCFVQAAADARKELATAEASDQHPDDKAREVAQHTKTIEESELRAAQSAYNAAQGFARAGKTGEALTHLQFASEHPQLREKADALSKLIDSAANRGVRVIASTPAQGAAGVGLSTPVRIQFSDDINTKTVEKRVKVSYSRDESTERGEPQPPPIVFTTHYRPDTRTLEVRPSDALQRFREVRVELLDGITGRDGTTVPPWTLVFTTGGSQ
jgi:tetratricopeptide (TPR) repeat protein